MWLFFSPDHMKALIIFCHLTLMQFDFTLKNKHYIKPCTCVYQKNVTLKWITAFVKTDRKKLL